MKVLINPKRNINLIEVEFNQGAIKQEIF